jgi:hypothetical protein
MLPSLLPGPWAAFPNEPCYDNRDGHHPPNHDVNSIVPPTYPRVPHL